jgi:hypothetical protein
LRRLVPVGCVVKFFGWCRWLAMLLGHFLFRFQENGAISRPMVGVSFMKHALEGPILHLTPAAGSICIAASSLVVISSWIICPGLAFWPRRPKVFLPIFCQPAPVSVYAVNLPVRCVETCCAFFAFAVLEWP